MVLEKLRSRFRARMHARNPRGWLSPDEREEARTHGTYSPVRPAQRIRFSTAARKMDTEAMERIRQAEQQASTDKLGRKLGFGKETHEGSLIEGFPPWMRRRTMELQTQMRAGTITQARFDAEMRILMEEAYKRGDLKIQLGKKK